MGNERYPSGNRNRRFGSENGGNRGDFRRKQDNFKSGSRPQGEDRVMYDAVCAECGDAFQVPFEPDPGRSIYCRACMKKRDASRSGERKTPVKRHGEGRERSQQYEIVCSHCGKHDTAPFKPDPNSIVFCHECMANPHIERNGSWVSHEIICSACGRKDSVPFNPEPGSRVLCHECIKVEREEKQRRRERGEAFAKKNACMSVRIEIRCEQCGAVDVLPFMPKTSGKILCRQCAEKLFGEDWARRNCVGAREYPFTCARCAAQGFVPFKPREGQELLCNHCLEEQAVLGKGKGQRFDGGVCIRHAGKKEQPDGEKS